MTYEYLCGACGHEWEAEQSINDKPLKKCPKCGKRQARRQVSGGTGFLLKGGGWYADGYADAKGSSSSDEASTEAKSPSTSDKKSSDSSKPKTESDKTNETNKTNESNESNKTKKKGKSAA